MNEFGFPWRSFCFPWRSFGFPRTCGFLPRATGGLPAAFQDVPPAPRWRQSPRRSARNQIAPRTPLTLPARLRNAKGEQLRLEMAPQPPEKVQFAPEKGMAEAAARPHYLAEEARRQIGSVRGPKREPKRYEPWSLVSAASCASSCAVRAGVSGGARRRAKRTAARPVQSVSGGLSQRSQVSGLNGGFRRMKSP